MGKLEGFEFWKKTLNGAKLVVAPMVDQSELAWRMLSRRYSAELCYTPMFHAAVFVRDANYRKESLQTCSEDRPLIVQFCANDPDTFLKAAEMAQDHCDAIDLNLGCPQSIAKRGHYGAFLQDEWELLEKMVSLCHQKLKVPITCKIRVFESKERTVKYAKMLERAGCQLLTVHGRNREQKGRYTGLANWDYIKAVRENVSIPVYANGNIQYLSDVHKCMEETGVHGVMSAEGNLHNPALFAGQDPFVWDMAEEYLDLAEKYPCPLSYARGHMFKILHHSLNVHAEIRDMIAVGRSLDCFKLAVLKLKEKCLPEVEKFKENPESFTSDLPLPYWICQPYVRPNPELEEERKKMKESVKRHLDETVAPEFAGLSKNKMKKLLRNPNKKFKGRREEQYEKCFSCTNCRGKKCAFLMCKICCKKKTLEETLDCKGHGIMLRTKSLSKKALDQKLQQLQNQKLNSDIVVDACDIGTDRECDRVSAESKENQELVLNSTQESVQTETNCGVRDTGDINVESDHSNWRQINGVWHTGIVVYGREFFFGGTGGIESCNPGGTMLGQPDEIVNLGETQIPYELFHDHLFELAQSQFRPSCYHLLDHNCNTFSSEIAKFLTGNDIPSHITGLPAEVLSTPFGQMIRPFVDAMSVQPSGGHALFDTNTPNPAPSVPPTNTFLTDMPNQSNSSQDANRVSPSNSQDSKSEEFDDFQPESEDEKEVDEPIIYKDPLPELSSWKNEGSEKLSDKDLTLIKDIYDYCKDGQRTWSLSKDHIQTIHKVIGDGRMGDHLRVNIGVLLQDLVLIEDFVTLLDHEPTKLVMNLMQHFEEVTEGVQISVLKFFTNCCSSHFGHTFLTRENGSQTSMMKLLTNICVNCLLKDDVQINQKISALVFNLSRFKMPEDNQVEIGSAILECLQRKLEEQTAYNLMKCLLRLMEDNEMCDLAGVVGMNCSTHQKLSARVRNLCDLAMEKTAL
ncbi:hypothetical protein FSP39_009184 [Pinctada imbricata]|uniref:tRNA-dihydrouridine(16/17) synthase [NAD(P)(+)]-like n=1 Tax=Pinctada imbricata TaxID=66713 RepID=A0AA89BT71_PINIB|nr:hypothetical protein FSP39_009184 [Pinctada imbricata]